MKNLHSVVIEAHEFGFLNADLFLFFNNFAFSDINHYEIKVDEMITFPSIVKVNGFNQYCYCFGNYFDEVNNLLKNYDCFDSKGQLVKNQGFASLIDSYVQGFKSGYDNFLIKVKETQTFNDNHEEQSNLIFKRVLRPDLQKRGKFEYEEQFLDTQSSNFQPPSPHIKKIVFDEQKFYESGKGGGEYFKAWEIIFENQKMFYDHFTNAKISGNLLINSLVYEQKLNLIFDKDKNDLELNVNHPSYNSNFDLITFRLFMYMLEEYENEYKNKYANIFLVLKEFAKEGKYHFRFTREKYKQYLFNNFQVVLKKIEKSDFKFYEDRKTLLGIESKFRTNNL
jgi:hypothetical protein